MSNDKTLVAKLKGSEPERFVFVSVDSECGAITRMSQSALSEGDLWAELHKTGMSDNDIRSLAESARQHPIVSKH